MDFVNDLLKNFFDVAKKETLHVNDDVKTSIKSFALDAERAFLDVRKKGCEKLAYVKRQVLSAFKDIKDSPELDALIEELLKEAKNLWSKVPNLLHGYMVRKK